MINLSGCFMVTGEGMRAVSSLPALTKLDLSYSNVTDQALQVLSSLRALTTLNLRWCHKVMDEGIMRAVSSLPALTSIDLRWCNKVTAAGVQALRSTTAAPNLHIEWEPPAEDEEDAEDSDDSEDGEEWEEWGAPPLDRVKKAPRPGSPP
jgi:F-box/leucine-rich repeat protein 14